MDFNKLLSAIVTAAGSVGGVSAVEKVEISDHPAIVDVWISSDSFPDLVVSVVDGHDRVRIILDEYTFEGVPCQLAAHFLHSLLSGGGRMSVRGRFFREARLTVDVDGNKFDAGRKFKGATFEWEDRMLTGTNRRP